MTRTRSLALAAALAATLAAAPVATAQPRGAWPNISPPILLQLEGTIHDGAEAARKAGFTMLSVGFYGYDAQRYLGVDDARTVGPETALDGKDVLAEVAPLHPNLLVTGPPAMVRTLLDLPQGKRVRTEGLVMGGSRTYYLRSVEVDPKPREHSRLDGGAPHGSAVALSRAGRAERGEGGR